MMALNWNRSGILGITGLLFSLIFQTAKLYESFLKTVYQEFFP
jgi:hypothetical protein